MKNINDYIFVRILWVYKKTGIFSKHHLRIETVHTHSFLGSNFIFTLFGIINLYFGLINKEALIIIYCCFLVIYTFDTHIRYNNEVTLNLMKKFDTLKFNFKDLLLILYTLISTIGFFSLLCFYGGYL